LRRSAAFAAQLDTAFSPLCHLVLAEEPIRAA
jgi:hypothetical protein